MSTSDVQFNQCQHPTSMHFLVSSQLVEAAYSSCSTTTACIQYVQVCIFIVSSYIFTVCMYVSIHVCTNAYMNAHIHVVHMVVCTISFIRMDMCNIWCAHESTNVCIFESRYHSFLVMTEITRDVFFLNLPRGRPFGLPIY